MLKKFIPAFGWLKNYQKQDLKGDFSAGLIVAIMLIPQGMAYAMLAGLPPVIGLYASTIPLIIYALFGSSRQLAVGPVAMVSLLVFTGVSALADPGTEEFVSLALLLALMVGVIQLAMGLFRLGFLVNFLSHAVISGFTSGAALIIGLSQLKHLLGIDIPRGSVFLTLSEAAKNITDTNVLTLLIGITSIAILLFFKMKMKKFPAPLVVVVGGTLLVSFLNLKDQGVKIVGEVPMGLPQFSLPAMSLEAIMALLPIALTISFVGFMESIAVAKAIASKEKYKVNSNQELNGLGLANIIGSFFSAYPVTGGFSRSAVNYQAGARTGLATIITAVIVIISLMFFTPLFYYLPKAVLAAIIMVAVFGLIDVKEAIHLFKVKKADGWTLLITFIATLTLGIEQGILVGVAVSLLLFIWRSAYPHTAELGYLEKENVYKNIKNYPHAKTYEGILIYRLDASLYFANMAFFEEKLRTAINEKKSVKKVLLDFTAVNSIDAVAIHELEELVHQYEDAGIEFFIAGMKRPVHEVVERAGWTKKYGDKISFISVKQAIEAIR
ncbi:sodium-independent anion transporter [Lottiidibacillus patelloidae]|uniref:Sodium-independent anion transporter n=1 Tax=Lottiidibacillus patelloidae TaxID=2670334 RepID=A0A263BQZ1_9BACI|nr:solute carrier family 26 protein [Lottiidibacillus patelloidae]OZM56002.1 sodium-independent anion transporter [Lottiidibacillus patelloidae]